MTPRWGQHRSGRGTGRRGEYVDRVQVTVHGYRTGWLDGQTAPAKPKTAGGSRFGATRGRRSVNGAIRWRAHSDDQGRMRPSTSSAANPRGGAS